MSSLRRLHHATACLRLVLRKVNIHALEYRFGLLFRGPSLIYDACTNNL